MVAQHSSESIVQQLLAYTPVADSSFGVQAAFLAVALPLVAIAVNVAQQLLLPRSANLPPVVFHYVPIIGSAITYGMDPYRFFFECREKYGDVFTFVLLGRKVTVALGSKGSNLIFNGKLSQVSAEEAYTHLTTPVFGKEVVYDVPNHVLMEQKRFVKVGLSTDNFRVYVGQIVDEVSDYVRTDPAFRPFVEGSAKTADVDIFKAMCEITILTASRTLQGKEVRAGLNKTFAQLYHDLDSGFTPINFVIPNLPLPNNFKRDRAQRSMSQFYQDIIAKRRKEGHQSDEHDMISALMEQSYKNGRPISDVEIAHMMIALLMAGQHTSSATGSWALLRLASRPEIIEELWEEQVAVYGDGSSSSLRPLDYDTQKSKVPKLDAVVRETLRLHPPIHSIMRKVVSDMPVPSTIASPSSSAKSREGDAYVIPKGHYVLAAPGVSQVDPRVWKDADVFDPARWLSGGVIKDEQGGSGDGEKEDDKVDFGWGMVSTGANSPYLPFGAGRHRCIGEQFAYLQLGTIIATMVRNFRWKLTETGFPEPDYTSMVVLPKSGTMRMTLRHDMLQI
ncbi:uncharacterized protein PFL1_01234 [Pseudozyma flocculosa PF-1]|uniref:Probable Sterol 14 alpha-demethylase n=1 Tax=Pseudozyma flocculosa TaxID=84751 RepID=A0A5C3EVK9_9BASI|nr:uncharacterized protein PFL1_01234 [Pseudozyma flocculosa PF-1]EPQ31045.1 hypothetical protein PFL1_01234 [Pseudozyma flocculosa PF-1]SPO35890.1 probable Sterol 14 alpha-demethylase [Pseudozyma flocculosa]